MLKNYLYSINIKFEIPGCALQNNLKKNSKKSLSKVFNKVFNKMFWFRILGSMWVPNRNIKFKLPAIFSFFWDSVPLTHIAKNKKLFRAQGISKRIILLKTRSQKFQNRHTRNSRQIYNTIINNKHIVASLILSV